MENIFKINFYIKDYIIVNEWFFELLPEIFILFFILYNLINLFNDVKKSIFQYYKIVIFFTLIFFILFWKICMFMFYWNFSQFKVTTKIFLGFAWIDCFYILFSKFIIISLTLLVLWIAKIKIKNLISLNCIIEFPLILTFSMLFLFLLSSSYDFFGIYLAMEGLSLTLYVLASMTHKGIVSIEASIKYFSLGAISSGIFLFGISIIFGIIGALDFLEVQIFLSNSHFLENILEIKFGLIFILFGFFFKLSAFPCHIWVADVYEGIWTPITAFFAIVIKVSLMLFFIRFVFNLLFNILFFFQPIFIFVSIGSMFIGALGAIKQVRIKRFIAYTSINQVGFIFLGIASCNLTGLTASLIYLMLYSIMSLSFFGLLLNTEHMVTKKSMVYLSDIYCFCFYDFESSQHLVLVILSMAGLPPLAGFIGKLLLYFSVMEARLDFVIIFSLLISIISVYYYLSFVRYIWFEKYKVLKLYYYKNEICIDILLKCISFILVFFLLFLPEIYLFFFKLSLSCGWPIIWC